MEKYFTRLAFYIEAKDLSHVSKAVLLSSCGAQAFSLIETLLAPIAITDETVTFKAIQTAALAHMRPKKILHFERHILHSMTQKQGEGVASLLQRLKDQVNKCEFAALI